LAARWADRRAWRLEDLTRRGRLRTAEGPIEYGVPQVRDRAEPLGSHQIRAGRTRSGQRASYAKAEADAFASGYHQCLAADIYLIELPALHRLRSYRDDADMIAADLSVMLRSLARTNRVKLTVMHTDDLS